MKTKISYVLIFLLLFSCKGKEVGQDDIPVFELSDVFNDKAETVDLEDICDNIQVIPLETSDDILINVIADVEKYRDKLYVKHNNNNKLSVFDLTGKYLYQIGSFGQGPGEYTDISDIHFYDDTIYIHDYLQDKVFKYSLETRGFLGSWKYDEHITDFHPAGSETLLGFIPNDTGKEVNQWMFYDTNGTCIDSVPPTNHFDGEIPFSAFFPQEISFYNYSGLPHFKSIFNDTVFTVLPNRKFKPLYVLDVGENALREEVRWTSTDPSKNLVGDKKTAFIQSENDRYILLYGYGLKVNSTSAAYLLIDKKENITKKIVIHYNDEMGKLFDQSLRTKKQLEKGKPVFIPFFFSADGKTMFTTETSAANEEDNPIIVMATLKD